MCNDRDSRAVEIDNIKHTLSASMARTLQSISSIGAGSRGSITSTHVDWIGILAKVEGSCKFPLAWSIRIDSWWDGKSKSICWQRIRNCLESQDRLAISQPYHSTNRTSKRMARHPYFRIRVHGCHIAVQTPGRSIVSVLLLETFLQASQVASICTRSTVAYLTVESTSLLTTATAEEEVIVLLVVRSSSISIPDRQRGSL